jgi:hypothetical protein
MLLMLLDQMAQLRSPEQQCTAILHAQSCCLRPALQ